MFSKQLTQKQRTAEKLLSEQFATLLPLRSWYLHKWVLKTCGIVPAS